MQRILVLRQELDLHILRNVTDIVDRLCRMLSSANSFPTCEQTLSLWELLRYSHTYIWKELGQCGAPHVPPSVMFMCMLYIYHK